MCPHAEKEAGAEASPQLETTPSGSMGEGQRGAGERQREGAPAKLGARWQRLWVWLTWFPGAWGQSGDPGAREPPGDRTGAFY